MIAVIAIVILIALNGFFVAAEFAIVGSPRAAVRRLANEGNRGAARVLRLLDDPTRQDRFIATAQLGITVSSLALGMVGEHALASWLAPRMEGLGVDRMIAAHTAATIVSVAVLSYFHIVFGEMVPKSLALHRPQQLAMWIAPLMRGIQLGMYPLIVALNAAGNGILRLMGIERTPSAHERFRTPDELAYEVRQSQREGQLPDESAEVMQELLSFTDLMARSVMVPRVYVAGIPVGANTGRVREILSASAHTRYPVFDGSLDRVVGVLHVKDILRAIAAGNPITAEMARPATFVAESACVEDVLQAMRSAQTQMTIVMDEHGGTAGIVTIEDLFEEVVGDIGERSDESPDVAADRRGVLHVRGTARIAQLGDALGTALSHPRVDTVSGLVLTLLGRPAQRGDRVGYEGVTLEVTRVRGRGVAECIATRMSASQRTDGSARLPNRDARAAPPGPHDNPGEPALETLHDAVEAEAGVGGVLGSDPQLRGADEPR